MGGTVFEKKPCPRKMIGVRPARQLPGYFSADLSCGHSTPLETIDGELVYVHSGTCRGGVWSDWTGTKADVGVELHCYKCSSEAYVAELQARPPTQARRYESREALIVAEPWKEGAAGMDGPVHKHGEVFCVQVYLGQHEWVALNVDDLREAWDDPGWLGDEQGWGWVTEKEVQHALDAGIKGDLVPPERAGGKPITNDQFMLAEQDKLEAYLGPDDPLLRQEPEAG
jgi:hypothetical protein